MINSPYHQMSNNPKPPFSLPFVPPLQNHKHSAFLQEKVLFVLSKVLPLLLELLILWILKRIFCSDINGRV